ncbi:MAG TPA: PadR family transcriptional regulator, partial [Fimbriimonas sp.]|nr:PadR family transcriptional regulator [Fimbriimonas sp.]
MKFVGLDRRLSVLELTALGILYKKGPCVGHAVLLEFSHSQTLAYRTGAGSIYPLLKRLHAGGFIELVGKKYAISQAGLEALREWFGEHEASTNLDPIRSKLYFLGVLSVEEQIRFVDESLVSLREVLTSVQQGLADYVAAGSTLSQLAMRGAEIETEARIQWLTEVR